MLDAGGEPRHRLRYELTAHAPERIELDLKIRINTAFTNTVLENGNKLVDFPTLRYVLSIVGSPASAGGQVFVTARLENVSTEDDVVDPALRRSLDAEIPKVRGALLSWRRSPSGTIAEIRLDAPELSSAQRDRLRELADAMTPVIFPDADLGVGASWQAHAQVKIAGAMWDRTITYRLKALADATATIEAITEARATSQALSVEPNATIQLTSGTGHETSDLVLSLDKIAVTGRSEGTSEANLQIVRGHLRIISTVTTETITSLKRLPD